MGKTFRFDPDNDSTRGLSKGDRKRLKQERKARRADDAVLDKQMEPTDDRSFTDRTVDDAMDGGWDKF